MTRHLDWKTELVWIAILACISMGLVSWLWIEGARKVATAITVAYVPMFTMAIRYSLRKEPNDGHR